MVKPKADPRREPVKAASKKKNYGAPTVIQYGDISKLTAGSFSHGADGIGMTKTTCL